MVSESEHMSDDWRDWARWAAEGRFSRPSSVCSGSKYPTSTDAARFFALGLQQAAQNGKERDRMVRNVMAAADRRYRKRIKDAMKKNAKKYAKYALSD